MEKEYLVLFGTVIGFLGSLLVTFLNNKQQIKKVRLENEHNIRLEELKIVTSIKKDQLRELLPKLEEAAALVSKLSMGYSLTASYIDSSKKVKPQEYNEWYLESNRGLDRLAAIIRINFDELSDQFDELAGLTNVFWGNQKNLLQKKEEGDKDGYRFFLDNVVKASSKIHRVASRLLNGMSALSNRLNESLLK
jgi:hypothetical protein